MTTSAGHDAGRPARLSFGQERLWFLHRLDPQSPAYNRPWALRLRGSLDKTALQAALARVVERHLPLRATVHEQDGIPYLHDRPGADSELSLQDLSAVAAARREKTLEVEAARLVRRPFDLRREPPFRPRLLRLAADDHLLLLTTHHIAFDAWSERVLARELAAFYRRELTVDYPAPTALTASYMDYAEGQRRALAGGAFEGHFAFWQELLGDVQADGRLSRDPRARGRPNRPPGRRARALGRHRSKALRALCAHQLLTPFMVFSGALAVLLARLESASSVILGYPIAGRTQSNWEPLIGLFLNTLPLPVDLGAGLTGEQLLGQVKDRTLRAADHQALPFERIVDRLQPPRSVEESPFFNVHLNFRNLPPLKLELPGLEVSDYPLSSPAARYDLTLYVTPGERGFGLEAEYDRSRQTGARVGALLDQWVHLIGQLAAEPARTLETFSLLPEEQRALFPDPARPLEKPVLPTVLEAVHGWVERTPAATAVLESHGQLTYRQLWVVACREAENLKAAGVTAGSVVALSGPRGAGYLAGMLGCFLCGATILPLDTRLPTNQRLEMLRIGQAGTLLAFRDPLFEAAVERSLTDVRILSRPTNATEQVFFASGDDHDLASGWEHFPDPAYLVFTSGTMGRPKPILGSHQGLSHFVRWQRETFDLGPDDRAPLINNFAFDVSLRDIFTPLTSGGSVAIPDEATLASGRLLSWLGQAGVTFAHLVPSIATFWLAQDDGQVSLDRLRFAFFAGEPLSAGLVKRWRARFPKAGRIINFYGPTETTMTKCWFEVPAPPPAGTQPLGRPLPNSQALVLNEAERLCGVAEPGQIVLRTPFRTHGYGSSAVRAFRRNFFASDPDDLLFETGDLGRYRADGILEYLGRLDDEVKIRGVRVRPLEVEAALASDDRILSCAVVPRADSGKALELAAYLVPTGEGIDLAELRQRLAAHLPPSWVPSHLIPLETLPLTPNGKLDRDALPPPGDREPSPGQRVAPANELERSLLAIWQDALNVGEIGVTDDYFDLGGHSLLALRLFADIEKRMGHRLPISTLFEAPTVRELALHLDRGRAPAPPAPLVPIQERGRRPPVFWIHAAGGHVLSYRNLARHIGSDQPFYALQGQVPEAPSQFRSIEEMAAAYLEAIQEIQPRGPYALGGLSFGGLIAWEMAQQLVACGQQVAFLGILDTKGPAFEGRQRTEDLAYLLRERVEYHRGQLALRPPSAWLSYLTGRVGALIGRILVAALAPLAPQLARRLAPLEWELRQTILEAKRARDSYVLHPYPGKIWLFRASRQPDWSRDAELGWSGYAQDGVEVREVPGTHVSIISGPNLAELASEISSALEETWSRLDAVSAVPGSGR